MSNAVFFDEARQLLLQAAEEVENARQTLVEQLLNAVAVHNAERLALMRAINRKLKAAIDALVTAHYDVGGGKLEPEPSTMPPQHEMLDFMAERMAAVNRTCVDFAANWPDHDEENIRANIAAIAQRIFGVNKVAQTYAGIVLGEIMYPLVPEPEEEYVPRKRSAESAAGAEASRARAPLSIQLPEALAAADQGPTSPGPAPLSPTPATPAHRSPRPVSAPRSAPRRLTRTRR